MVYYERNIFCIKYFNLFFQSILVGDSDGQVNVFLLSGLGKCQVK